MPNALASMIIGISSLVLSFFFVGLVLGIVGLILSNKAQSAFNQNPNMYTGEGMIAAGRVTSVLGIIFGAVSLVSAIASMLIFGCSMFYVIDLLNV